MATVTKPIALDESLHTTEQTPRNLADVLAQALQMLNTTISGLNFINCVVVQTLPTTDISTTTIYLVPKNPSQTDNLYDEYINLTGTSAGWEKIGDTEIDLSGYYTSAEVDDLLADKADVSDIPTVNDGTLTIQQNGETKGTFTANQSGNSTVNIETPTTDIQTAVDQFETYNGGLLSSLKVALVPVQSGSGDPSPDNVRPISGHTQAKVKDDGKNRLKVTATSQIVDGTEITVYDDGSVNVNGTPTNNNLNFVVGEFSVDSNSCILNGVSDGGATTWYLQVVNEDETTQIGVTYNGDMNIPITANTTYKVRIRILRGVTLNNVVFKPMIRLASESDPTFVPYNGYRVTVNLGGTYYSGILDIVSGVLTVTQASYTITTFDAKSGSTNNNQFSTRALRSLIKPIASNEDLANLVCDRFTTNQTYKYLYNNSDFGLCQNSSGDVFACFGDTITNLTDANTWLSSNPIQFIYELATPQTIQLTPQQVKALVGENHLTAPLEGQEITESKYKQMFTFDDVIAYIQSLS